MWRCSSRLPSVRLFPHGRENSPGSGSELPGTAATSYVLRHECHLARLRRLFPFTTVSCSHTQREPLPPHPAAVIGVLPSISSNNTESRRQRTQNAGPGGCRPWDITIHCSNPLHLMTKFWHTIGILSHGAQSPTPIYPSLREHVCNALTSSKRISQLDTWLLNRYCGWSSRSLTCSPCVMIGKQCFIKRTTHSSSGGPGHKNAFTRTYFTSRDMKSTPPHPGRTARPSQAAGLRPRLCCGL